MALTLHQLELFKAVAKQLNVTRTSREKRVDQSAISHQIKRLEREFGQAFVRSHGRGIALTEKGTGFSQDIEPILSAVADLYRKYGKKTR